MRSIKLILLLLLLYAGLPGEAQAQMTRPDPEGAPTRVTIALYIIDVEKIDNIRQSFTLDFIMRLKWMDSRLEGPGMRYSLEEIWHPNVQIYNERHTEKQFEEVVVVLPGDTVQYTQRYHGELTSFLDFHAFPHDTQTLPVSLLSFGYRPDEVEFVFEAVGSDPKFSIPGWKVEMKGEQLSSWRPNITFESSEEIVRPRLDFYLEARRYMSYYVWKVLAPLMIIVFLSWAVFWIEPTHLGAQIGVSATSILTLIAFLLRLESILPPVPYLTRMDNFVFAALVLVFLAYEEALTSGYLALNKEKQHIAFTMDRWSRMVFPIAFIIIMYWFWLK